jgi:branched-chain amino acid transport system permease protein
MVVLGGMGNFWGVAIGAFVIYTINNVLLKSLNQFFDTAGIPILKDVDFIQLQFLLYGLALVTMMLVRPEGLFPNSRRKRELHSAITGVEQDELGSVPGTTEEDLPR